MAKANSKALQTDYQSFLHRKTQLDFAAGFEPIEIPDFLFPFQRHLVDWAIRRGRAAIFADCGLGKALDSQTPVMTPSGMRAIGELIAGDMVIGADGDPTPVLGVFPQGMRTAYRVTFSDGTSTVCDIDHLWSVQKGSNRGGAWKVLTLREIMEIGLGGAGEKRRARWFIPSIEKPVEFLEDDLPLHPYVLGVLLGDGHIRWGGVSFSSADMDLVGRVEDLLPNGYRVVKRRYSKYDYSILRSGELAGMQGGHYKNQITEIIESLGICGLLAHEKFIPDCYKYSSSDTRLELLRGLMDTDGSIWMTERAPVVEFSSSSKRLAEDVRFLIQSFGGKSSMRRRKTNHRDNFRLIPSFPRGINPFWLPRKASLFKGPQKYLPKRSIRVVEKLDDRLMTCIKVAAHDGLFVIENFLVTHNTPIQLVWADNVIRKTGNPVLILTPLSVSAQTVREAKKFGFEAAQSRNGEYDRAIVVTNYEQLKKFSCQDFSGVVCDESSILKNFDGKMKAEITEFMRTVPYRLLCTATPSPNDFDELGTSSEALGELGYQDMITRFFKQQTSRDHLGWGRTKYKIRGHAERDFWRWITSWSRACRKPSDLGFEDGQFILPKLNCAEHVIVSRTRRPGFLFDLPATDLQSQREERRRTIEERCERVVELVSHDHQSIVWCHLNPEGDLLEKMLNSQCIQVSGKDSDEAKEEAFLAFETGQVRVMVTKPSIAGFGLNWQHCWHQTFFPSHSFEEYYQATRRSLRFGQTHDVQVDTVTSEGEQGVLANLQRKAEQAEAMFTRLTEMMATSLTIKRDLSYPNKEEIPSWLSIA